MMVTRITSDNRKEFFSMAPGYLWDAEKRTHGYFFIGGLWEGADGSHQAAGCLIFCVRHEMIRGVCKTAAAIRWLYVEPAYRKKGIASGMLDACKKTLMESGITDLYADLRKDDVDVQKCLRACGFSSAGNSHEIFRIPLAGAFAQMKSRKTAVCSVYRLQELNARMVEKTVDALMGSNEALRLSDCVIPDCGAYDSQLSCATMESGKLRTLLLLRQISDQVLRVVVFRPFVPDAGKELEGLLQTLIREAAMRFSSAAWLEFLGVDPRMKTVAAELYYEQESYTEVREICELG